jgi:preprotein translocase subunit Sss1
MFIVPGYLVALVTFPGVIVHELAHYLFCILTRTAVFEVCYLRSANPCGYVIHEIPRKASHNLIIGIGPYIVNTLLALIIGIPVSIQIFQFNSVNFVDIFLFWVAISVAMHSFPSTTDANGIWKAVMQPGVNFFLKVVSVPLVGIIYLGALGSIVMLDIVYGVGLIVYAPRILCHWLV